MAGQDRYLSIAEAAERLGKSTRTVRRWIQQGKLKAELQPGPYGEEYRIPAEVITTAQEVTEVVKIEKPASSQDLALAIAKTIEQRDKGLREELTRISGQVERLADLLEEQGKQMAREKEQRRPWWKFWAGG